MLIVKAQLLRQPFSLDVDLEVYHRVTAIFGASGAGKSTLLNIIAGITKPNVGYIYLNGLCLLDTKNNIDTAIHQRHIGLVFQDARLFPHLTVEKNLRFAFDPNLQKRIVSFEETIALLEISTLLGKKPHALSGGEKQRVALGRALLSNPQLLMLDEPLASLDGRLKAQILPFLERITQNINIPMLYISHDMHEIKQITDHVIYMENGKITT